MTPRGRGLFHGNEDFERPGTCRSGWPITHVPLTVSEGPFGDVVTSFAWHTAADRVHALHPAVAAGAGPVARRWCGTRPRAAGRGGAGAHRRGGRPGRRWCDEPAGEALLAAGIAPVALAEEGLA
ncbi:MAG: hypothetical protein ACRDSZ_11890 [Pseudonocardiaceae bacterium]